MQIQLTNEGFKMVAGLIVVFIIGVIAGYGLAVATQYVARLERNQKDGE